MTNISKIYNKWYKLIVLFLILTTFPANVFACKIASITSAPKYYKTLSNYGVFYVVNNATVGYAKTAPAAASRVGASLHHIIPRSVFIAEFNAAMVNASPEQRTTIIAVLSQLLENTHQNTAMDSNTYGYIKNGINQITGDGNSCGSSVSTFVNWLPSNLFRGPLPNYRAWDPGSNGRDTWFITYKNYYSTL